MKNVGIVGCGYAGLSAAWKLGGRKVRLRVTVFDKSLFFHFLPLLPDVIGRGIPASALRYPISLLASRYGFDFLQQEVISLDLASRTVNTSSGAHSFDYLIIASGTQTNFYGNSYIQDLAYKLDDSFDSERLLARLRKFDYKKIIVSGGGYTGIEAATNIRRFLLRNKRQTQVTIVERAPGILGPLPQWMKEYVAAGLKRYNIEVLCNSVIEKVDSDTVLVWTAGVKTADYLQKLSAEKNPQGRLKVNSDLTASEGCFVCGDSAFFEQETVPLRMAVQFAIAEGKHAALNIKRSIDNRPLRNFKPVDLGYIIPMANNAACGVVLGWELRGFICILFHYLMSVWRAYGLANKLAIVAGLLKRGLL